MNDKDFNQLVNAEIREDANREDVEWLRRSENLDRWLKELVQIKMNVEKQLANARYDRANAFATLSQEELTQWNVDHEKWRAGVIRFKTGVDKKLVEVKYRQESMVSDLLLAISRHCAIIGDEGGEADEELWATIGLR